MRNKNKQISFFQQSCHNISLKPKQRKIRTLIAIHIRKRDDGPNTTSSDFNDGLCIRTFDVFLQIHDQHVLEHETADGHAQDDAKISPEGECGGDDALIVLGRDGESRHHAGRIDETLAEGGESDESNFGRFVHAAFDEENGDTAGEVYHGADHEHWFQSTGPGNARSVEDVRDQFQSSAGERVGSYLHVTCEHSCNSSTNGGSRETETRCRGGFQLDRLKPQRSIEQYGVARNAGQQIGVSQIHVGRVIE